MLFFFDVDSTDTIFVLQAIEDCILMELENASHMVMLEQPDQVNALIHEFINISVAESHHVTPARHKPPSASRARLTNSTLSLRSVKSIPSNLLANNLK